MNRNRIYIAGLSIIIYGVLMEIFRPTGLSAMKIALVLMVWISFFLSFSTFIGYFQNIKADIPQFPFIIFITLLTWNIINILRSLFDTSGSITTMFGNTNTSLALLVPFALSFCFDKINLKVVIKLLLDVIKFGIPFYLLFLVIGFTKNFNYAFQDLFYNTVFLITIIPFLKRMDKLLVLLGSIILFYVALRLGYRVMDFRILALYLLLVPFFFYRKLNFKVILIIGLFSLFIPFYLLILSIREQQSVFEKVLPKIENEELSTDTRTFLYIEVFNDLKLNNKLYVGKGSGSTYFSPYFYQTGGDSYNRLNVEVGVLGMLLKGGIVAVVLNLSLLLSAIYLALFRSNNFFVVALGFMLILHFIILFMTNYFTYSAYNFMIWFFIGVCLSKEIRSFNDKEMLEIFNS